MYYIAHFQSNTIDLIFRTRSARKLNAQCRKIKNLHDAMLKHEGFDPKARVRQYNRYTGLTGQTRYYKRNKYEIKRERIERDHARQSAHQKVGLLKVTITRSTKQ